MSSQPARVDNKSWPILTGRQSAKIFSLSPVHLFCVASRNFFFLPPNFSSFFEHCSHLSVCCVQVSYMYVFDAPYQNDHQMKDGCKLKEEPQLTLAFKCFKKKKIYNFSQLLCWSPKFCGLNNNSKF